MKKIILLILMFAGFTIQAQRYLSITNPTNSAGSSFRITDNDNIDVTASQSKTITFKMRIPVGANNVTAFGRIMQKINGTAQYGITIGSPVSNVYRFATGNSTTAYGSGNVAVPTLTDGNWHHIVMVLNDANKLSKSTFYIDGTLVYTTAAPASIDMSNTSVLVFGSTSTGGSVVTMDIDDIRFYNASFTPSDIITDRTTTVVNNSTPNILAAYDFEGTATLGTNTIPDVTGITNVSGSTVDGTGTNNTIAIATGSSLPLDIWRGTTNTSWTTTTNWSQSTVPTSTSNVTIGTGTNQPSITTNLSINSLAIASGATLNVASGNLTVTGAVTNSGAMTLENNSNLIQGGTTNTNTGNITVNRNSNALHRLDYTMWSSPVSGAQTLADFSPLTSQSPNRFYTFDPTGDQFVATAFGSPFDLGTGYLIRMPNTDPTPGYDAGTAPLNFTGVFTGKPNTGDISVTTIPNKFNGVGNPYPSVVDADLFKASNTDINTLYFFRKTNNPDQLILGSETTSYAVYNIASAIGTGVAPDGAAAGEPTITPDKYIQVGQGFVVETPQTSVVFNNGMRVANNGNKFLKTKQIVKSAIWLNLSNPSWPINQMALSYIDGASVSLDETDSKYINDSSIALTSNINNGEYTIQGRPVFDPTDVVALNFKTDVAGDYTIALDHFDGLFATGQDIFLADSKTGTETDLKAGAYTFNAVAGVDNARFSLKYQKTLKVDAPAFNDNSVRVYKNNGTLYVNSGTVAISNIKVFDIQGRLIAEQKNLKTTTAVIKDLRVSNQVLIVKIAGEDNNVVTKKVVN